LLSAIEAEEERIAKGTGEDTVTKRANFTLRVFRASSETLTERREKPNTSSLISERLATDNRQLGYTLRQNRSPSTFPAGVDCIGRRN
jgi:hypothetical protein